VSLQDSALIVKDLMKEEVIRFSFSVEMCRARGLRVLQSWRCLATDLVDIDVEWISGIECLSVLLRNGVIGCFRSNGDVLQVVTPEQLYFGERTRQPVPVVADNICMAYTQNRSFCDESASVTGPEALVPSINDGLIGPFVSGHARPSFLDNA
jgi:hypothetical protein